MAKQKLSGYNLSTLLELEKASRIVCMKYESASKNYDGSIINNDQYVLFKKYNDFRSEVISEMEKRLNEEIDE
jgi:hypothetical protein